MPNFDICRIIRQTRQWNSLSEKLFNSEHLARCHQTRYFFQSMPRCGSGTGKSGRNQLWTRCNEQTAMRVPWFSRFSSQHSQAERFPTSTLALLLLFKKCHQIHNAKCPAVQMLWSTICSEGVPPCIGGTGNWQNPGTRPLAADQVWSEKGV